MADQLLSIPKNITLCNKCFGSGFGKPKHPETSCCTLWKCQALLGRVPGHFSR